MCFQVRLFLFVCGASGVLAAVWAQAPRQGASRASASPARAAVSAQPDKEPNRADAYAGEAIVVERLDSVYRYNSDGTGTKLDTSVTRVQTEAAVRTMGQMTLPYATGSQRLELVYLRVRKPNGTIVETPATDAQDVPAPGTVAAPLYSDLHLLQLPVRGLGVGDRVEYQVRTVFTRAEATGQFWGRESFGRGVVVLQRSVELRVPRGTYVQVSSPKYPAEVSEEGAEKVYRWKGSQPHLRPQPKTVGEANEPTSEEADRTPPIAWTTFRSWAEVGDWYRGWAFERSTPTPTLKAKADGIVYGLTTPEAKIRALYGYVSSQIRSVDVPTGAGRSQPHPASEVLENQYGDSPDKATLLAALLRAENLPESTVLIGAGADVDEAVPAPGWFNHEITLIEDEKRKDLWLDTLPEVAPFGMLQKSLRDKLALVIPSRGEAVLRRTPAEPPFPSYTRFDATGTLTEGGELKAHVDVAMRGDDELVYREGLRAARPSQWDRLTEYFTRSEGLAGLTSNTVADSPEMTEKPLHVSYDYREAPYGDWPKFRVVPLQPPLKLPLADRKAAPETEISFGGKRTETAVSRITLPPGFGADLPPALHVHNDFLTLDWTYGLEKVGDSQVLVTERVLAIEQEKLPAARWAAYRQFLDDAGSTEPWVQLTSLTAAGAAGRHPPAPGESNSLAAELVEQANRLLLARDLDRAKKELDQAKAVNPRQALLWSEYGYIAAKHGELQEASDDYRLELKQHPAETLAYRALAGVQVSRGDVSGAERTLQAALAVDSKDEGTWLLLSRIQLGADAREAEATLRSGIRALPESLGLKLALGEVLLQGGKGEEGGRLLLTVATDSQDPAQLNDAAYLLGDTALNLPAAEAGSRRAIYALNAASAQGTNRVGSLAALRRSMLLIASWDTYGWILYRKGSYSEAEPWLRAAWFDGFGALPGQHLAALLGKQGRGAEAARILRLVQGATSEPSFISAKRVPVAGLARPRAGKAGVIDTETSLRNERTFSVRRSGDAEGRAVFEIDYSLSTTPVARFVEGEQKLATAAAALGKLDTRTVIPPGSTAHLLRRGVLTCQAGQACSFVLLSPGEAAAGDGGQV